MKATNGQKKFFNSMAFAVVAAWVGTASLLDCFGQADQAQDSFSNINLSPSSFQALSLTSADMASVRSISDEELTNFVGVLSATPTIPYASLPKNKYGATIGGTFFSLQHLGEWPPLPLNPFQRPVWQLNDCFIIDDLGVDYDTPPATTQTVMTLSAEDETYPPVPGGGGDGGTNTYTPNGGPLTVIDYGTNLYIFQAATVGGYLTANASNTIADVTYEILSRTNLIQADWHSEGTFPGSELTNWTPFSVFQGQRTNLFIRLRSWQDTYNIGIPDWWQILYFGTNGINAYASAANDGFSNIQKFDMGLNPTNYYNPFGPPGFFGYLDATGTNVFIAWSQAPGPVVNYSIQRGVSNSLSGLYSYSQIATVSSNANFIEDVGGVNNGNALNNIYQLEAVYPGGSLSATDTWQVVWFGQYGTLGAPYGPPSPTNFYACADTNATNILLSWTPASSVATNYLIERGIFNTTSNAYVYRQIASVGPTTNSFKVTGPFTNADNWSDNYALVAVYPGGVSAPMAISPVNVGWTNGLTGPNSFYGYADGTGTNLVLTWTPAGGTPTNYVIFGGNANSYGAYAYHKLASANGTANSLIVTNGISSLYDAYAIFAVYTNGSLSQSAVWQSASGTPPPGNLVAYLDATGTNVWLSWTAPAGTITGYQVVRFDPDSEYFVYNVNSNTTSFEDQNAVNTGYFDPYNTLYTVQAFYPHGGASVTAWTTLGTLPSPTSLSSVLDVTGKNVTVTWNAVPGAMGYEVDRGVLNPATGSYAYTQIASVGSGVTSYVDTGAITGPNSYNNHYQVAAIFPGGVKSAFNDTSVSESSDVPLSNVYLTANLVRNGSGRWQVMFSGVPTNSPQTIQLSWGIGFFPYVFSLAQTNLSTTNLTGGIFQVPDAFALDLQSYESILIVTAQLFGPNGEPGQTVKAGLYPYDAPYFVDGRRHMKQNLNFLLRAAAQNQLFFAISNAAPRFDGGNFNVSGTSFEEFSFLHHVGWGGDAGVYGQRFEDLYYFLIDDLWPFTANYDLANYLVTSPGTSAPYGNTNFVFQPNFATNIPAPAILGLPDPYRILQPGLNAYLGDGPQPQYYTSPSAWGVSINAQTNNAGLASGNNLFGLSYNSGYLISHTNGMYSYQTLSPGANVTVPPGYIIDDYASWSTAPSLSLVNYYFAPLLPPQDGFSDVSGLSMPGEIDPVGGSNVQPFPVPIEDDFNVTNQTPPIIASVGQPIVIGGWAKYAVGGSGKFAYLGQYFQTNAFLLNSNGVVTTNTAGIMSPYGEFFPLQTGVAQFTTMPDIDNSSQQGTNVVKIISMNVDANHDGTLDTSYAGPDFVSASRPFRFWCANDNNVGDFGGNGIPGNGVAGFWGTVSSITTHGRRNLEDFFPVYLNIGSLFQSNSLNAGVSLSDTNWHFILSQSDVKMALAYTTLTPTNYMNYLRDITVSSNFADVQIYPLIGDGSAVSSSAFFGDEIPRSFLYNIATNNGGIILVEAYSNTVAPIVLTIYHYTNQVARTSLPVSITSIEQMFRSKTIMLNSDPRIVPDRLTDTDVTNEPDTIGKNFVFVHGYNVNPREARGVAADMYKRMYWSGSHAKFWAVTWEGADTQLLVRGKSLFTPDYHSNVFNAFNTAPALATFAGSLTGPTIVAAHSLGNMVVLDALDEYSAPINQYFMMDAAVSMEAIDPTVGTNANMIVSDWQDYSNRLYAANWFKVWPNTDYRSTLAWSKHLTNFNGAQVYNFYSSGEEVLREWDLDAPTNLLSDAAQIVEDYLVDQTPVASYVWVWQEKSKGLSVSDTLLGSSHGGWKLNTNYASLTIPQANALLSSQLQTNAFFDFSSPTFSGDLALENALGNVYAYENRNRILSDAIPALSFPVGANPVPLLSPPLSPVQRNFDMQTLENGWPAALSVGTEASKWHHSDFHQIAYTFTYQLFNQMVTLGNLK